MALVTELLNIDRSSDTPIYLQITNALIHNIHLGRLRKGLKLPGSREIANALKINRMTVVAAFEELDAQGWTETLPRKGTFIKVDPSSPKKLSDHRSEFTLPHKTGFSYEVNEGRIEIFPSHHPAGNIILRDGGYPDVRLAPIEDLVRKIRSLSRISSNKKYLMFGNAQGTLYLREHLAEFLNDTRGLSVTPDNILITKGAQMGIYIAASLLLKPADEIVVGTPGYIGANSTFKHMGARINHVAVEADGLDIDAVEKICQKKKIRLVYVIPHHHHPTTATLTPDKRLRLLALAAKFKFAIIEDDYDYDFQYAGKPMMPMASLDLNGNVIYLGTLTKYLAPAIRLGFIVAPAAFIRAATHFRRFIDSHGDSIIENAIAEMFKDGTIVRHIKKSVKLYKERRDYFCGLLKHELGKHVSFRVPEGGMLVWTTFLNCHLPTVTEQALTKGLVMGNGTDYDTKKQKYNAVGLGFASLNFKEQEKAITILREILEPDPQKPRQW